jgi:16S rRNA (guanine527-N7)-methyltransferase
MERIDENPLEAALQAQGLELPPRARRQLNRYCHLLWQANRGVNLTRHTNFQSFVSRDLVDVMQLSAVLPENQEILDIGSGGGVPGLVLALIRPDLQVSLCESVGKKAAILADFVEQLQLPVAVHHDRAEDLLDDLRFDACVARAAGPMWKLLTWLDGRWLQARRLLAFKGPRWVQEVTEARHRGLTRGLLVKPVAKYPLHSTDPQAPPLESLIIEVKRATT